PVSERREWNRTAARPSGRSRGHYRVPANPWIGPLVLLLGPVAGVGVGRLAATGPDPIALGLIAAPFALLLWLPPYAWALAAVAAVVFGRLLTLVGGPSILHFAHFPFTLTAVLAAFLSRRSGGALSQRLAVGCGALLVVALVSGVSNDAGLLRTAF